MTPNNMHKHKHQSSNKRWLMPHYYGLKWLLMTAGSGGGVAAHCGLLARTLDWGGGSLGVHVGCVEDAGLTLYHPHVTIYVSQLDAESLDLVLSSQQTSAQLHRHILVVYHLHPGDIPFHPTGLELIFLSVGQEVVDWVLQLALVAMDPWCDGLLGGISNSVTVRSPESWSLVSTEDPGSEENLCDGLELHSPWTRNFLDPIPGSGGDAQVLQ
jgi:hypothetical protein